MMSRNGFFYLKNFLNRKNSFSNQNFLIQSHGSKIFSSRYSHIQTDGTNSDGSLIKLSSKKHSTNAIPKLTTALDVFSEANFDRVRKDIVNVQALRTARMVNMKEAPAKAGVLVPLCYVDGKPSILFTVRNSSLRKHRGDVSFPGGKMDHFDKDIIHAALRETQEEIGISMDTVTILGVMPSLPMRKSLFVKPVLGFCGEVDLNKLDLSPDEVEEVFVKDIESLCDLRYFKTTQFRTEKGYTLPVYTGGKHRIWGLTAVILHQTLSLLAPALYTAKVTHRP